MKRIKPPSAAPKRLVHDLQALIDEAEALMTNSTVAAPAGRLEALKSRFAAAQQQIGDTYAEVSEWVGEEAEAADETIRANVYSSLAVAAGVGLLVGLLVGGRGDK